MKDCEVAKVLLLIGVPLIVHAVANWFPLSLLDYSCFSLSILLHGVRYKNRIFLSNYFVFLIFSVVLWYHCNCFMLGFVKNGISFLPSFCYDNFCSVLHAKGVSSHIFSLMCLIHAVITQS